MLDRFCHMRGNIHIMGIGLHLLFLPFWLSFVGSRAVDCGRKFLNGPARTRWGTPMGTTLAAAQRVARADWGAADGRSIVPERVDCVSL